jgi:hypothetical protein
MSSPSAHPLQSVVACVLLFSVTGCSRTTSSSSGIQIAPSDDTPPTISLGAGQGGGQNVSVSAGGSAQNMKLNARTGSLNLLATAADNETGIRALEIWMTRRTTTCNESTCTSQGPGIPGKPRFESTSDQMSPGETTASSSVLAQALDLSQEIPQGATSVELVFFGRARNHLGGSSQTPSLKVTWSGP